MSRINPNTVHPSKRHLIKNKLNGQSRPFQMKYWQAALIWTLACIGGTAIILGILLTALGVKIQ